jgi:D-arabinose 1-dehydrogenase-like Zn-dependent alcohol dehydrogenase
MIVDARQCLPVPDATPLSHVACAEPLAVCLHALGQAPDLIGRRVLVTGSGPIGVLCVALAKRTGAAEIVVTDLHDLPLQVALQMGVMGNSGILKALDIIRREIDLTLALCGERDITSFTSKNLLSDPDFLAIKALCGPMVAPQDAVATLGQAVLGKAPFLQRQQR